MAIETLNLQQIYETSEDTFEAVVKASKRAKQILNKRNYEKQMLLESLNENEDVDSTEVMIQTSEERESEIHPVTVAIEELLAGKLVIKYEKEQP